MGRRGFLSHEDRLRAADRHDGRVPPAPKGLSPAAKREWRRVTRLLAARGIIDSLDRSVLHGYIEIFDELPKITAEIEKTGRTLKNARGEIVKHPLFATLQAHRSLMLNYARELGFSVAARTRLSLPKPRERGDNPWQHLFDPVPADREPQIDLTKYRNFRPLPGGGDAA